MNMTIKLKNVDFFKPLENSPEISQLLAFIVTHKLALGIKIGSNDVTLSSEHNEKLNDGICLVGRWRSPLLASNSLNSNALLLIPFVFLIEELYFPRNEIFTFGLSKRTVADLFMRNLFYAAVRRERITFQVATQPKTDTVTNASRNIIEVYQWIAKSYLKDEIFERKNLPELILASAHLPLVRPSNPLLERGLIDLRNIAESNDGYDSEADQKEAFLFVRQQMLELYKRG